MHKNDFAPIPPMGWNSYDYYDTTVTEEQVKDHAHYMAEHLKEYGWEYIVACTEILPDEEKFPSSAGGAGYKPLADYIHRLGLKFGVHITGEIPASAIRESQDFPAVQAYYDSLLALYASWGVDFIQCDTCIHDAGMLSKAIKKCGHTIILSLAGEPPLLERAWHYATQANMWRITDDKPDNFKALKEVFRHCEMWQTHVRKGSYPDCGILPFCKADKESGNSYRSPFTPDEAKTLMTLWCLFGSPLMLGGNMTELNAETLHLLTNPRILALCSPECLPHQICRDDAKAIWQADNMNKGEHYIALFNLSEKIQTIDVTLQDLGYYTTSARLTESWTGNLAASRRGKIAAKLKPHACVVYRVEF